MKAKTIVLVLSGLVASCLAVRAQDYSPAVTAATIQAAAPAVVVEQTTAPEQAAAPAPAMVVAQTTPAIPAALTETAPAHVEAVVVSPVVVAPVIPLIVMDDVPLTDAIKNLARQANLNYMLDPRLTYGQPGPDGKPTPQPSVSIRWENITAAQALNALLNNNSLQR